MSHSDASSRPHADAVRRACLPEILFLPDLALALGVTSSAARRALLRGDCGPYFRVGRRYAVRRAAFLAALEARETTPAPANPVPTPKPPRVGRATAAAQATEEGQEAMSAALQRVLDALDAAGCRMRGDGAERKAQCPSHDDREPSLSVGTGDDGRVLLNCPR